MRCTKPIFKLMSVFIVLIGMFSECSAEYEEIKLTDTRTIKGELVRFENLEGWAEDDHVLALSMYQEECQHKKLPMSLKALCKKADKTKDAKHFFESNFNVFKLYADPSAENLLTGYYEPQFRGSRYKNEAYKVPLYKRPKDLLSLDPEQHPSFKKYKYLGKVDGRSVAPYYTRHEINQGAIQEKPLCYMRNATDRFFLQVQGSGRIIFEDKSTMFVGYDGQNGHPYHSIGKAFVASGKIAQDKISLQSIRVWLNAHSDEAQDVLESNPSFVFFNQRSRAASGAFGMVLTPKRSVAIDRRKLPLGFPLFVQAENTLTKEPIQKIVYAQDTGGAIRGAVRADLFFGFGEEAERMAGAMNAPLKLYVLVPITPPTKYPRTQESEKR